MSLTANKNYNNQLTGSNPNTWGIVLNSNFSIMDANLGGRVTVNVAGAANYNVTANQAQSLIHILTGVLTGNIQYIFPSLGGMYQIINNTTGNFTVTANITSGIGAGVVIPQSGSAFVFANPDVPNITGFNSSNYFSGGTTTGIASAQVLANPSPGNYTLAPGNLTSWKAGFTSAGAMTLNINGTGAIAAKIGSPSGLTDTIFGSIVAGCDYLSLYDQAVNAHVILNKELPGVGTIAALNIGTVIVNDGSGNATIGANAVTNAMGAQMAANTIKSNITGGSANPSDNTLTQILDAILGNTRGSIIYRGASSWAELAPGTAGQSLVSNGSGADPSYKTISGGGINKTIITSSTTFTTPSSITTSTQFKITAVGAGGGAAGSNTSNGACGGGGAGSTCIAYVTGLSPSTGYAATIGSGGVGGVASTGGGAGQDGGTGGTTSIVIGATTYSAGGGSGGLRGNNYALGGSGGTSSNGSLNITGGDGGTGFVTGATAPQIWLGGFGGASSCGGGPRTSGGTAGTYGAGGAAGINTTGGSGNGGAGGNGIIIIEWVA